jgi:hypothetical protein
MRELERKNDERPARDEGSSSGAPASGRNEVLYDGEHDWLGWRPELDEPRRKAHAEYLVQVLAGMNPDCYDIDSVELLARELLPERVEDVIAQRLERSAASMPAVAIVA